MSPWRQVTHDPGTTEASPLPFSTAPTLERALSSSFFSSFPSFLASPRLAVTSRKKRAKQRRGPLDLLLSAFFFPSFSLSFPFFFSLCLSLLLLVAARAAKHNTQQTTTPSARIDVHGSRVSEQFFPDRGRS